MSIPDPLWCIVCRDCGCIGSRWEKPGTAGKYVKYCAYCGGSSVKTHEVETKEEYKQIRKGEVDYDEL